MRELVYTSLLIIIIIIIIIITIIIIIIINNNNRVLFHLWWKGNLLNHQKVSNIMNMIVATTCFKQYSIYSKSAGAFSDFLPAVIRMPFFEIIIHVWTRTFYFIDLCGNGWTVWKYLIENVATFWNLTCWTMIFL